MLRANTGYPHAGMVADRKGEPGAGLPPTSSHAADSTLRSMFAVELLLTRLRVRSAERPAFYKQL